MLYPCESCKEANNNDCPCDHAVTCEKYIKWLKGEE